MCVPASDVIELSLESLSAQSATMVWNGRELIVAYWDPTPSALGEVVVQAVGLDGNVRWRATTPGVNVPTIAWNRDASAGLVFADAYVSWIGPDGILGASGRSTPPGGSGTYATAASIGGGFIVASG